MDNNYISFRKAKVGGFNKKDVINYIEKMRNDFYDYKKAVEATVDSLNAKISELEAINSCIKTENNVQSAEADETVKAEVSTDPISDINASAVRLRMVADELCRNLTDFMCTVSCEAPKVADIEDCGEAEEICDGADCEKTEVFKDKASEILSRSFNFSFVSSEESVCEEKKVKESKTVLDTLSSSSFFN